VFFPGEVIPTYAIKHLCQGTVMVIDRAWRQWTQTELPEIQGYLLTHLKYSKGHRAPSQQYSQRYSHTDLPAKIASSACLQDSATSDTSLSKWVNYLEKRSKKKAENAKKKQPQQILLQPLLLVIVFKGGSMNCSISIRLVT
jgi:hypothetical protein